MKFILSYSELGHVECGPRPHTHCLQDSLSFLCPKQQFWSIPFPKIPVSEKETRHGARLSLHTTDDRPHFRSDEALMSIASSAQWCASGRLAGPTAGSGLYPSSRVPSATRVLAALDAQDTFTSHIALALHLPVTLPKGCFVPGS